MKIEIASDPVASDPVANPAAAFVAIADRIREHARTSPERTALICDDARLDYAALDRLIDRIAASLQRDGLVVGDVVALCGAPSIRYAGLFLGALRAGLVVAPLAPSVTPDSFALMLSDAGAAVLFVDDDVRAALTSTVALRLRSLDGADEQWLLNEGARPATVDVRPGWPFNVIYSSGTTGQPKGIVQSHAMRHAHVTRAIGYGYGPGRVTLLATPLYSNTTLVAFFPSLAYGGTVVLMPKFDAAAYLALATRHRVTHTMLVPIQYQRLMALPAFGEHDLSAFHLKFSTSAPFAAALKADVLARWPGGLVEFYGMTEGGGTCILEAHRHPDKLHTVGPPGPGSDIRLIDEEGRELPPGATGEVVGHSAGMMTGYHGQPAKTREAEWFDVAGKRFIRTGDVGRFDDDGFLVLMDRRKDMIISGGFNLYPSDLEAELRRHPAVADVAVVGVPSEAWGETPIAFVVRRDGHDDDEVAILEWLNARVGRTQRIARLRFVDELPRSAIGKILKRELRDAHVASGEAPR